MRFSPRILGFAAFVSAAALSILAATWAVTVIEARSADGVRRALDSGGYQWASVETDGLIVRLSGTAPSEALRFRVLAVAGGVVDSERVVDMMDVTDALAIAAPDFSVEILRNDAGISVIGLIPAETPRDSVVAALTELAGEGRVTDMLESAKHPVPEGWDDALDFGLEALKILPRSKISISAARVDITAISDSPSQKARIEAELARKAPASLRLALDISAPRPVITPFTLRFLIDAGGPRFDACSADTEAARDRIIAAAAAAGVEGKARCTIGMGVPTPDWANAAAMAITALDDLGAGSVTFSDADISLIAADSVSQADFDRVVGELESNLPEVFSLHAVLTEKPKSDAGGDGPPEFTATLSADGKVQLRGRLPDERDRDAVGNFARARFGNDAVFMGARLDSDLPKGWPVRVLAALEGLAELHDGSVTVLPDIVRISGVTGSPEAGATIARLLAARLGETQEFSIDVRYNEKLDPLLGLPTAEDCVKEINGFLAAAKISFEPGSATITTDGAPTLDRIAERMKDCDEFPMEVGGYTDSQGREEMNQALSQQRAQAVIAALMERRALTGNLRAVGYGEANPIGDNETEEGREANRRIEFTLVSEVDGQTAHATAPGAEGAAPAPDGEAADDAAGASDMPAEEEGSGDDVPGPDPAAPAKPADREGAEAEPAGGETGIVASEADADTPVPQPRPDDLAPPQVDAPAIVEGSGEGVPVLILEEDAQKTSE